MSIIKNYLLQPSTWLGLVKVGASVGLVAQHLIDPIGGAVVGLLGLIDVIRKEKIK
jgi:hypothetical protein